MRQVWFHVRQRFTSYEKDSETGLDFAEPRYYNNQHARFTAVDPLLASGKSANPQTFNRYVYVLNSPLKLTDPTGLQVAETLEDGGAEYGGFYFPPGAVVREAPTIRGTRTSLTTRNYGSYGSVSNFEQVPILRTGTADSLLLTRF